MRVLSLTSFVTVDIRALEMVDEAYADRTEWTKKSIRTTAKVRVYWSFSLRDGNADPLLAYCIDGQIQLRQGDHGVRGELLEHREREVVGVRASVFDTSGSCCIKKSGHRRKGHCMGDVVSETPVFVDAEEYVHILRFSIHTY